MNMLDCRKRVFSPRSLELGVLKSIGSASPPGQRIDQMKLVLRILIVATVAVGRSNSHCLRPFTETSRIRPETEAPNECQDT